MKLIRVALVFLSVAAFSTAACGRKRTVTRTEAGSTAGGDLSGYWNDIDAEMVAKNMIKQCMESPWASNFQAENSGKRPVVKLMGVIKRTDDRNVNAQFFGKQLERQLLNSGARPRGRQLGAGQHQHR